MNYLVLIGAVILGAAAVFLFKLNNKQIRLLLAFSGAYLLSVTVLHLLPEVFEHNHGSKTIGILILAGILIQSVLESFSKGAEHGHIHVHSEKREFPWLLFISLSIHAFSEGLPIHGDNHNLLWAIVVHKIPIAIVLTTFLIQAKYTVKEIIGFIGVFAIMSPLGILVANKIDFFTNYHAEISALIIGVFLHISTVILFESTENHKFNLQKFIAIVLGMVLTIIAL